MPAKASTRAPPSPAMKAASGRKRACKTGRSRARAAAATAAARDDVPTTTSAWARVSCASSGARVLAFAGIGDPEKFFATLADAGVALAARRSFPDHHRYTRAQAKALCEEAARAGLMLVTTEKDLVRLAGAEEAEELAAQARALPVTLAFEDEERFKSLLLERLAVARKTNDGRGRWTGEKA